VSEHRIAFPQGKRALLLSICNDCTGRYFIYYDTDGAKTQASLKKWTAKIQKCRIVHV
jgi:hypothetical protein